MAFLKVNADTVAKEGQGGNFFATSGVFPVTIRACEIKGTTNGATEANYFFKEGNSFGNTVFGKDGKQLFGGNILEALGAIIGVSELADPEEFDLKLKSRTKAIMALPDLEDVETMVWVQYGYRIYNEKIQESISVKRFYRPEDQASGSEVLAGENIGTQFEKDTKYHTEVKYDNGLTAEIVADWKKSESDAAKGGSGAPAAGSAAKSGFPTPTKTSGFPTPTK